MIRYARFLSVALFAVVLASALADGGPLWP